MEPGFSWVDEARGGEAAGAELGVLGYPSTVPHPARDRDPALQQHRHGRAPAPVPLQRSGMPIHPQSGQVVQALVVRRAALDPGHLAGRAELAQAHAVVPIVTAACAQPSRPTLLGSRLCSVPCGSPPSGSKPMHQQPPRCRCCAPPARRTRPTSTHRAPARLVGSATKSDLTRSRAYASSCGPTPRRHILAPAAGRPSPGERTGPALPPSPPPDPLAADPVTDGFCRARLHVSMNQGDPPSLPGADQRRKRSSVSARSLVAAPARRGADCSGTSSCC